MNEQTELDWYAEWYRNVYKPPKSDAEAVTRNTHIEFAKWYYEKRLALLNVSGSLRDLDGKKVLVKFKVSQFAPKIVIDLEQ